MANNDFYNHGTAPEDGSRAIAAAVRAELDAITAAFAKLPTLVQLYTATAAYGLDTGPVNAMAVTVSANLAAYTDGMRILTKVAITNTGAATINVNGLGVRPIVRGDNSAMQAGDFIAGQIVELRYDGVNSVFQMAALPVGLQALMQTQYSGAVNAAAAASASASAANTSAGNAATSAANAATSESNALAYKNAAAASATVAAATGTGTALTGLSTATATPVVATDSILVGIGKLQGQGTSLQNQVTTLQGSPSKFNAALYLNNNFYGI